MTARPAVIAGADWRVFPQLVLPSILQVALEQMSAHGYEATTVRTIARDVGVTVPALYYHFANKQAILVDLLDRAIILVTLHIEGAVAEAGADPVKRLRAIVEAIALYSAHYREVAALDAERRSLTAANLAAYIARRDRIERELRQTIESGCRHGVFQVDDPAMCGRAILSMCQGISVWYRPDGPRSAEETAARYARMALGVVEAVRE